MGLLISALTESQVLSAVGTFGLLLVLYLWDGLVAYLPSTANGVPDGTAGDPGAGVLPGQRPLQQLEGHRRRVCGGSCRHHRRLYRGQRRFAGLLPDMLGRFSLLGAFDSFSVDHVFDVRGILLYLSLIALLVFLTVQVVQKRRWN